MGYSVSAKEAREKEAKAKKHRARMLLVLPIKFSFLNGVTPKPTFEVPAELATIISDVSKFIKIWELYFNRPISPNDIMVIIKKAGISKAMRNVALYTGIKVADGFVNEIANLVGPLGWLAEGIVAGSISLITGLLWIQFCHDLYVDYGPNIDSEILEREAVRFGSRENVVAAVS